MTDLEILKEFCKRFNYEYGERKCCDNGYVTWTFIEGQGNSYYFDEEGNLEKEEDF